MYKKLRGSSVEVLLVFILLCFERLYNDKGSLVILCKSLFFNNCSKKNSKKNFGSKKLHNICCHNLNSYYHLCVPL